MSSFAPDREPLPKQETLRREANLLFDSGQAQRVRKICGEISQHSLKNNIYKTSDEFHGELKNGFKTPHDEHLYEHLMHLSFFESQIQKPKLKFLDLCCGNGKFTYIARKKGHTCIATDSNDSISFSIEDLSSIETKSHCISAIRSLTREILNVDFINLKIYWNSPLRLNETAFDIIYINQATLHYPGSGTDHYWHNHQWSIFLQNALEHLNEDGFIFITLADPTYIQLSDYLMQFYTEYSSLLQPIHPTHWWPLLIIRKNQLDLVKNIDQFSLDTETKYFSQFGRSNPQLIKQRLVEN